VEETTLTQEEYKKMIIGASYYFQREKEAINSLNVFPVPDGDTGSNMSMTLEAAARGAREYEGSSIGEVAETVASHSLMGARGNSGVILSQLMRGLSRGLSGKDEIVSSELSKAFQYGVVYAYKAVSRPVEGTILTVAREIARGTRGAIREGADINGILETAIESGEKALMRTKEMLPVLKEAGVVDAGGKGLIIFLRGCHYAVNSSMEEVLALLEGGGGGLPAEPPGASPENVFGENFDTSRPYCTELIIKSEKGEFAGISEKLSELGDSLLVVEDKNICKVHIHTANPDMVLGVCLSHGILHDIKIDNMMDQHDERYEKSEDAAGSAGTDMVTIPSSREDIQKDTGIICVSFGEGIKEIFFGLGADEIVYGGQTMNPNVEDLLNAVHKSTYDRLIILPNNKNIQLVAEQVRKMSSKEVEVVKTSNIPEGIAALMAYQPSLELEENVENMKENMKNVKAGEITYAIRETVIQGQKIKKGSCLGLYRGDICSWGEDLILTSLELVRKIVGEGDELITIFYGEGVEENSAYALQEAVEEAFPYLEVELQAGGQPVYYFIISIE